MHDRVTRAIETIVRRQQSHVREDEEVLAIALMQIDVRLAQSNVEIDESRFLHVGLFEVAQLLLFGPFHDWLAVIDRPRSPERSKRESPLRPSVMINNNTIKVPYRFRRELDQTVHIWAFGRLH